MTQMDFQMLRAEVRQLSDNINCIYGLLDRMESKMTAIDHNSNARALNSSVTRQNVRLSPLKDLDNVEVVDFPESIDAINNLPVTQINRLLGTYGLAGNGTLEEKRTRFIYYIGAYLV